MNDKIDTKNSLQETFATNIGARHHAVARVVAGSLMLCVVFSVPVAPHTVTSSEQGTLLQDASDEIARVERAKDFLREKVRETKTAAASDKPDLDRLDITFNQHGSTNEIVISGVAHWGCPVKEFVNALSMSGALEGSPLLNVRLKADEQDASTRIITTFDNEQNVARSAQDVEKLLALARLTARDVELVTVLNNMTLSANGKQLVMKLEMSREQAGNLLHKFLALP
jgi:hypothetical protein